MKNIVYILFLFIFFSCDDALFDKGPVVTKQIETDDFREIYVEDIFDIYLLQDTVCKISVKGGSNVISNIHFEGAILRHCTFQDGKIHDCFFEETDLTHADFKNASLNNCGFQQADCTGMDLNGAKLISCSFVEATIKDITTSTTIVDQKTTFVIRLTNSIAELLNDQNFSLAVIPFVNSSQSILIE